jgi:HD superfamily phosphohydrolase
MVRVSRHRQLSTLKHVYPGAEHKRSEHIAGVLNTVVNYVRALYADRSNPFWRLNIERSDIEALLLAALLHDIGHIAFGHYVEELLPLFNGRMHEDYIVAILDASREHSFGPLVRATILEDRKTLEKVCSQVWGNGTDPVDFLQRVANILQPLPEIRSSQEVRNVEAVLSRRSTASLKIQVLHSIIDSAIDADKLDYLIRDAVHCGVQYAKGIDLERFYQALTVLSYLPEEAIKAEDASDRDHYTTEIKQAGIAVTEKGVLPVESMLVARYQMFNSVYWNKTARAETAMLQFLLTQFVQLGRTESKALQRLDNLIQVFRDYDDTKAMNWLSDQFANDGTRMSDSQRSVALEMCGALLGDRDKLYWSAFEMQYRGPGTSEIDIFRRKDARTLYDRIVRYWEEYWQDSQNEFPPPAETPSPLRAIQHWTHVRRRFADALGNTLGMNRLPCEDGDLLIDVPPAGKDQIRNVYVVGGSGTTRIIQQSSPIADAVSDAFRYWTRRIRIFLSPKLWNQLERKGFDDDKVRIACHSVMHNIVQEQSGDLFRWMEARQEEIERRNRIVGKRARIRK